MVVPKSMTKAAVKPKVIRKAAAKAPAKLIVAVVDIRVWCEWCSIRIAPSEEQAIHKGKSYHQRCYSRVVPALKIKASKSAEH